MKHAMQKLMHVCAVLCDLHRFTGCGNRHFVFDRGVFFLGKDHPRYQVEFVAVRSIFEQSFQRLRRHSELANLLYTSAVQINQVLGNELFSRSIRIAEIFGRKVKIAYSAIPLIPTPAIEKDGSQADSANDRSCRSLHLCCLLRSIPIL
jgi:hypothetical protein